MMTGEEESTWQGHWRKHAMVKNILGEMPILGPFFLEARLWDAVPKSLHAACMFFGGIILMSTNPFGFESDNTGERVGEGVTYMGLGMWAGAVSFHAVDYSIKKLCSSSSDETESRERLTST